MTKPPLGVTPHYLWAEANPDPTLGELLGRWRAVAEAVRRYREAGLTVHQSWLSELGLLIPQWWGKP